MPVRKTTEMIAQCFLDLKSLLFSFNILSSCHCRVVVANIDNEIDHLIRSPMKQVTIVHIHADDFCVSSSYVCLYVCVYVHIYMSFNLNIL